MICSILIQFSSQLLCDGNPQLVIVAEVILIAIIVSTVIWVIWRILHTSSYFGIVGGILVIAASLLLVAAVSKLTWINAEKSEDSKGLIAVLIDNSESVHRQGIELYREAIFQLANKLEHSLSSISGEQTSNWEGLVQSFTSDVEELHRIGDVATLPEIIRSLELNAIGNNTNISLALKKTLDVFKESSKSGQIWLLSDGNATEGDIDEIIDELRERAIPVNILGFDAGRPKKGLWSADIANEQTAEITSTLRSNVFGGGKLSLEINGIPEGEPAIIPDEDNLQPLRHEILFDNRGINAVELQLEGNSDNFKQNERMYTLVKGPAQILSFGNSEWLGGINEERYLVTFGDPKSPHDARKFDAVVINGLEPSDFEGDYENILLSALAQGVGVFIANGPIRGSKESPQLISDWEEGILGPILPVNSDPLDYVIEPPARDVLVIVDTSGSMVGDPLFTAKSGIHAILDNLRPVDTVLIQPFASFASPAFGPVKSTIPNLIKARNFIDNLRAGGASNLDAAISIVSQWKSNHCGVFIFSDGYVDQVNPNRLCFPTAIGVANFHIPGFENHGQSYTASSGEILDSINFEYFKPELREIFWREGRISPLILENWADLATSQNIDGIALTYARADSIIAVVPDKGAPDPVLVFRKDPVKLNVRTGVFLGELASNWREDPMVGAILKEVIGWKDPNRFAISLTQLGSVMKSKVTTLGDKSPPTHLEMQIYLSDDVILNFQTTPTRWPGVFEGELRLPSSNEVQKGILILKPRGEQVQEIPITLPPNLLAEKSLNVAENLTYGLNFDVLSEISSKTGGLDISDDLPQITERVPFRDEIPIWPYCIVVALLLFATSLYTGGCRR